MGSKAQPGRRDLKRCPWCRTTMFLDQITASFGPLPETWRYYCPNCRDVVEEDIGRDGRTLSAIRFAEPDDWPGTRRVVN
jgi:hypothetical protein